MSKQLVERANQFLEQFLARLSLGDPDVHDGLWAFPILGPPQSARVPEVAWGPDLLHTGNLRVQELPTPQVNTIQVENRASRMVVLFDGEELVGARQNRILNSSVALAEGRRAELAVSCVEQGRWAGGTQFRLEGRLCPVTLRAGKHRQVTRSLRESQSFQASQSEVWSQVRDLHTRLGTRSATGSMTDGLKVHDASLRTRLQGRAEADQVGLLAVLSGAVLGLDVVGSPQMYAPLHGRLLESYAIETVGRLPNKGSRARAGRLAEQFLSSLRGRRLTVHPSLGSGYDIRFETDRALGSALLYAGAILHLAAFPEQ